jgi:hypothetical protein
LLSKRSVPGRWSASTENPLRIIMMRITEPLGDGLNARNSGLSSVP